MWFAREILSNNGEIKNAVERADVKLATRKKVDGMESKRDCRSSRSCQSVDDRSGKGVQCPSWQEMPTNGLLNHTRCPWIFTITEHLLDVYGDSAHSHACRMFLKKEALSTCK